MGMTLTEKILARASGRDLVRPGENLWVTVDSIMTHDVCGPGTFGIFDREFGEDAVPWKTEAVIVIPDHYIFTEDDLCKRNIETLRRYASRWNLPHFYDVGTDAYQGVCHVALPQRGHIVPGEVFVGTDSHTCTAGAFGAFATGIGNTDAAFVLGTGKILLKIPPSMRFVFEGYMPGYLMAKDLILHLIGEIGTDGATYRSMHLEGETISALSMEERMVLTNMVVEAGAKNGTISPDDTTFSYLEGRISRGFESVLPDPDAKYETELVFDTRSIEPTVAEPHSPDKRARAADLEDVKLDRVYIGSCTGGKTEDFVRAAEVLDFAFGTGAEVKVETFLVPATREVVEAFDTVDVGGRNLREIFESAGCKIAEGPSCSACLGGPSDTFGRLNEPLTCISTTNRNFPGRMGHKEARVYLASPATAASSALTGHITDPRIFLY